MLTIDTILTILCGVYMESSYNNNQFNRVYLDVSYAEKELAKSLGARWDARLKKWYILHSDDVDYFQILRWIPRVGKYNFRAQKYYILTTNRLCWKCKNDTKVHSFYLHNPEWLRCYSIRDIDDEYNKQINSIEDGVKVIFNEYISEYMVPCYITDDGKVYYWERNDNRKLDDCKYANKDFYVCANKVLRLNKYTIDNIKLHMNDYYLDNSKTAGYTYYMNHCEHCNAKQGDWFLHDDEWDGVFGIDNFGESALIKYKCYPLEIFLYANAWWY